MVSKIHIAVKLKVQIDKIKSALLTEKKVKLSVLRSDLIHAAWSGNKYFKLKYNIEAALEQKHKQLLTFGGAFSNHIAATAAAGKANGIKTIGIIRGEKQEILNSTLSFARDCGMELCYVSREKYSEKNSAPFIAELKAQHGNFYLVPEGGSNLLGVKGCSEMLNEVEDFDVVCCACGTGATLAGIVASLKPKKKAIGFSSLKGGAFLENEVADFLQEYCIKYPQEVPLEEKWLIITDYHFGGYAKTNDVLFKFAKSFFEEQQIELDYVYTAKMMYGIFDLISKNYFAEGTRILVVHTGGLQGNAGFVPLTESKKIE